MEVVKKHFLKHEDTRGKLIAIEAEKDVPFQIQRVYYIYDTKDGAPRGFHAHKALQQYLVCMHGSCKILLDDGAERTMVELSDPSEGLYIGPSTWREMYDFSSDAVLVVFASMQYDESDYIRDYNEFLQFVERKEKA